MWVIRFYTGPLAGKKLPLKAGRNVIGRANYCDVVVPANGISKEHAVVEVYNDRILVKDLESRNGTFINGVMIRSQTVSPGDRVSFHDIVVDIVEQKSRPTNVSKVPATIHAPNMSATTSGLPGAISSGPTPGASPAMGPVAPTFLAYAQKYVEDVVLPGVYRLGEMLDFRWVLALFVGCFIVLVTSLSTIPLMRILKASIEQEAHNHALTIARNLAEVNRAPLQQGLETSVSVTPAMREPGVDRAYVISSINQDIIAPVQQAGQYVTDIPFVSAAIKGDNEAVSQISSSKIAAVVPIRYYHAATGSDTTAAYAVVVYNMGTLAVDNGRTLSLFVEILFIAALLGLILYFFMYRLIRQPIIDANKQLIAAMAPESSANITSPYLFTDLQILITSINNLLHRQTGGFGADNLKKFEIDRSAEMQNIVNLVGFPAFTVQAQDRVISSVNEHFIHKIAQNQSWVGTSVDQILDQALKLNVLSLLDKVVAMPSQIAIDQLEISSESYDISAQGIHGSTSLAYVLIVFVPNIKEGQASA